MICDGIIDVKSGYQGSGGNSRALRGWPVAAYDPDISLKLLGEFDEAPGVKSG